MKTCVICQLMIFVILITCLLDRVFNIVMTFLMLVFYRVHCLGFIAVCFDSHLLRFDHQIVMEFCGAGSVSDLMKIRNKTVSV